MGELVTEAVVCSTAARRSGASNNGGKFFGNDGEASRNLRRGHWLLTRQLWHSSLQYWAVLTLARESFRENFFLLFVLKWLSYDTTVIITQRRHYTGWRGMLFPLYIFGMKNRKGPSYQPRRRSFLGCWGGGRKRGRLPPPFQGPLGGFLFSKGQNGSKKGSPFSNVVFLALSTIF